MQKIIQTIVQYIDNNRQKSLIIFGCFTGFIIIVAICFSIWQVQDQKGKIPVKIMTAPNSALVKINDQKFANGTAYLKPGKYKVEVSQPDFETKKLELEVSNTSAPSVLVGLVPQNEKARNWQQFNQAQYKAIEREGFKISQQYGQKWQEKWPIIKSLPIKDPYFTISYRRTAGDNLVLTIEGTSPRYRQAALKEMYRKNIDPTDYQIKFIGFKNPLGGQHE